MPRNSLRFLLAVVASCMVASSAAAGPLPAWDKVVAKSTRYKILAQFDNEAVLDTETGLVWERNASNGVVAEWGPSISHCYSHKTGGRWGWRPPTFPELSSLADPAQVIRARVYDRLGFVRLSDDARERLGVSARTLQDAAWMAARVSHSYRRRPLAGWLRRS